MIYNGCEWVLRKKNGGTLVKKNARFPSFKTLWGKETALWPAKSHVKAISLPVVRALIKKDRAGLADATVS